MRILGSLAAVALLLSIGAPGASSMPLVVSGDGAVISAKKKCKKTSNKKPRKCKANKKPAAQKPWAGGPYRPGQVCSLAPEMQVKYKKYGLFCFDLGLGIWSLEPL
jgi:hypothetical protein